MITSLDIVTRKKLILVKLIYHRALIQSQAIHSPVDRILAVVGFDLANETILKAVVSTLNPSKNLANDFQGVLSQAENELTSHSITIPDKVKIQHVRALRNDAQHKARYPSDTEVSDCRTYTRDFLSQIFTDVWGESFDSFSLVDVIQNTAVKTHLTKAEQDFINGDYSQTVVKSMVAFKEIIRGFADSITENISNWVNAIVTTRTFREPEADSDVFRAFMRTRELVALQTIGISSQEFLKYKRLTNFIGISIAEDGHYSVNYLSDKEFTKEEAEYILNFVTNSTILVESLDEDIIKPYDRL